MTTPITNTRQTLAQRHSTQHRGVDAKLFADARTKGYENLTDKELNRLHTELMQGTLDKYENTDQHDFFVVSIANVALEKAKRRAGPDADKASILKSAQVQLYSDYRETGAHGEPWQKLDRKSTIYRDAERLVNGAADRADGWFSAMSTSTANFAYNAAKALGVDLSTSGDKPTEPGGSQWLFDGFAYGEKIADGGELKPFHFPGGNLFDRDAYTDVAEPLSDADHAILNEIRK